MIQAYSWTITSNQDAVKELEKSALIHKGIPIQIRSFFEIKTMPLG